ncbi:hypothetical protein PHMEG_00013725 [Phytophthora megakarya]|uniref:Tc1-like transposase DDE domain-containing protein n=1 Tax=Phytophthora megakarya TaxID=4795 RepID=A0A225W738_9STRA|nr:hypothetical protein PHMEG_00013725 [Phytophthora megakarya]
MRTAYRWLAAARVNDAWDDEMVDALEARFNVKVSRQTVKHHIDGHMNTMKQTHQDNNYSNLPQNKMLRRDYVVDLLTYKGEGKKIFYVDETNFNLWCSRRRGRSLKGKREVDKNTASKGSNIHVIACISEKGLAYSEKRFGPFTYDKCNNFIRRLLCHISKPTPLNNAVLVCDNSPCHINIEGVFEEEEFKAAKRLRLGPYSPMLNPIESCFSAFKSMVKRFLVRHSTSTSAPLQQVASRRFSQDGSRPTCPRSHHSLHMFQLLLAHGQVSRENHPDE